MTDLEKIIVSALRLSEVSAEALIETIRSYIDIARADIVRSGVASEVANNDENALVRNVILKYVVSEMASVDAEREKARTYYKICLDELRKSFDV